MPDMDQLDYSVVADRVAGHPAFTDAIKSMVQTGDTQALQKVAIVSLLQLGFEAERERRLFGERGRNGC